MEKKHRLGSLMVLNVEKSCGISKGRSKMEIRYLYKELDAQFWQTEMSTFDFSTM